MPVRKCNLPYLPGDKQPEGYPCPNPADKEVKVPGEKKKSKVCSWHFGQLVGLVYRANELGLV